MMSRALPVILIIIAVGLYFTYISPTYTNKVLPLKDEIARSDAALVAADDFKQKEAQITTERSAIPADGITRLHAYLPDGVDNVQLVLDLNALAARSGIALSNFKIKDNAVTNISSSQPTQQTQPTQNVLSTGGKTSDSLDLSVTATGTYGAFRSFLFGIEHSLRPLDITEMKVTDSATGVYSYDMTIRIYSLH